MCIRKSDITNRISIHAPPRGATVQRRRAYLDNIFQFTPLREGRRARRPANEPTAAYFNSRPSARGDNHRRRERDVHGISIHAPPRGATGSFSSLVLMFPFQFTPLREGRRTPSAHPEWRHYFNSRPSARGDTDSGTSWHSRTNFNSRPSARGDPIVAWKAFMAHLFQFTPLREGRRSFPAAVSSRSQFQFTPLREGRLAQAELSRANQQFQFTPLREGRPVLSRRWSSCSHFNSRPSARGDFAASRN